jgi:hypothetical protein
MQMINNKIRYWHRPSFYFCKGSMGAVVNFAELLVPLQDVVSFAFEKKKDYDDEKPLYIDADDPRQSLSYVQTLRHVRQLIAGLKAIGLQDGDPVLVHVFNSVSQLSRSYQRHTQSADYRSTHMRLSSCP